MFFVGQYQFQVPNLEVFFKNTSEKEADFVSNEYNGGIFGTCDAN